MSTDEHSMPMENVDNRFSFVQLFLISSQMKEKKTDTEIYGLLSVQNGIKTPKK
jgi:hypothetical protein